MEFGAAINWDSIGVGASAGSKFGELNESRGLSLEYHPFNAGSGVNNPDGVYMKLPHVTITNRDHFSNLKAQSWDEVATRFRKTYENVSQGAKHPFDECISLNSATIPPKILAQIKSELSAPRKDVDGNGRFKVESKKDLQKRQVKSPNVADAVIMAMVTPKRDSAGFFD